MLGFLVAIVRTTHDKTGKAKKPKKLTASEREKLIEKLTREMKDAARTLEFEKAAYLRDEIQKLREG